jgi:hypothetical protein
MLYGVRQVSGYLHRLAFAISILEAKHSINLNLNMNIRNHPLSLIDLSYYWSESLLSNFEWLVSVAVVVVASGLLLAAHRTLLSETKITTPRP